MVPAADVPTLIVASALATIAVGLLAFAFLAGIPRSVDLMWAGFFAGLYALRMMFATSLTEGVLHAAYVHSALEYLVPIPAAALFAHYFGLKLRRLNTAVVIAFIVMAVIAIPYETISGRPHAFNAVENALVLFFMAVFAVNIASGLAEERGARLIRIGSIVFGLYVVNEHLRFVTLPFRLSSEPIGFLIFMLCIVVALMRTAVTTEGQLLAVQTELVMARNIQLSIIPPRPPEIEGLDIAATYRPASHVGGDFYDFVPLADGRLGIFIADVSGHGVPAALVASMLKIALAAQNHASAPAEILTGLNRLFCGRLQRQFFSAAYAVIDPLAQSLSFASGGHPPLLLADAANVHEMNAPGFVLGRMPSAEFGAAAAKFAVDDVLLLYTDGVVEAARDGEQFGYERLKQCLAQHRRAKASEIAERVIEAMTQWTPHVDDDVTLVVVRRATRAYDRT
jgi:sigma-B regulation protein RsbU (phosphoserine phosphatase)